MVLLSRPTCTSAETDALPEGTERVEPLVQSEPKAKSMIAIHPESGGCFLCVFVKSLYLLNAHTLNEVSLLRPVSAQQINGDNVPRCWILKREDYWIYAS